MQCFNWKPHLMLNLAYNWLFPCIRNYHKSYKHSLHENFDQQKYQTVTKVAKATASKCSTWLATSSTSSSSSDFNQIVVPRLSNQKDYHQYFLTITDTECNLSIGKPFNAESSI